MKSTKTVLAVAIVIVGFASFGCPDPTDPDDRDARAECDAASVRAGEKPLTDPEFDLHVMSVETLRDGGSPKDVTLQTIDAFCTRNMFTPDQEAACLECWTAIIECVYP